jgi:hypothetical protein
MQKTQPKTFFMSENGTAVERQKVQWPIREILISVASGLIVAYGAILWNINTVATRVQEQQIEDIKYREEDRTFKNQMQLDIRDVRERLIRIENSNPNQQKSPL